MLKTSRITKLNPMSAMGSCPINFPGFQEILDFTAGGDVLVANFDGADGATTYTAESGQTATFTGSAQLDTAQYKLGTSSLLLGGGDTVTFPDSASWNFGTGNFTIEFWCRWNDLTGFQDFGSQFADGNNYLYWRKKSTGEFFFDSYVGSVNKGRYSTSSAPSLSTGVWYHIAFVRNGTTAKIFLNGSSLTLTETTAFGTNDLGNLAAPLTIGGGTGSGNFNGWIAGYRISKWARYTADFSVPTTEHIYDPIVSSKSVAIDGDTDKELMVLWRAFELSDMTLNGDTGGTSYGWQYCINASGSITASRAADGKFCHTNYAGMTTFCISLKSGFIKMGLQQEMGNISGTAISHFALWGRVYNSVANITSATFSPRTGNFGAGTRIIAYVRRSN